MKKIITIIMACLMALGCFGLVACGNNNENKNDKLSVVCTIFPEYDWVSEILGENKDNVELTLLLDNGVDLHSYQPSVEDIAKISTCDLFIYVGGESDAWVDNALKNAINKNMKVINLLDVLGDKVKAEETVEGMEHEHEHDHGHEEINEADIKDRTISDFAGEWKSLYPYLSNGDLDEYLEHLAEEDDDDSTTKETYREKYTASWACNAEKITVNGNSITFTYKDGKTQTATYSYAGYSKKLDADGDISSVRYQFNCRRSDCSLFVALWRYPCIETLFVYRRRTFSRCIRSNGCRRRCRAYEQYAYRYARNDCCRNFAITRRSKCKNQRRRSYSNDFGRFSRYRISAVEYFFYFVKSFRRRMQHAVRLYFYSHFDGKPSLVMRGIISFCSRVLYSYLQPYICCNV